jgi:hypothetical protein
LNGKAYVRAVRSHFLIYKAFTDLLLDYLKCQKFIDEVGDPVVSLADTTASSYIFE